MVLGGLRQDRPPKTDKTKEIRFFTFLVCKISAWQYDIMKYCMKLLLASLKSEKFKCYFIYIKGTIKVLADPEFPLFYVNYVAIKGAYVNNHEKYLPEILHIFS